MLIMNAILVIMILGLALLAQILLPHVEKLTLFVMLHTCYYRARKMKILLTKNLRNHQSRNAKTSLMFTIALGFLIFGSCNFSNSEYLMMAGIKTELGSDIVVINAADFLEDFGGRNINFMNKHRFLDEPRMRDFLD